jgi:hypothetical protein
LRQPWPEIVLGRKRGEAGFDNGRGRLASGAARCGLEQRRRDLRIQVLGLCPGHQSGRRRQAQRQRVACTGGADAAGFLFWGLRQIHDGLSQYQITR